MPLFQRGDRGWIDIDAPPRPAGALIRLFEEAEAALTRARETVYLILPRAVELREEFTTALEELERPEDGIRPEHLEVVDLILACGKLLQEDWTDNLWTDLEVLQDQWQSAQATVLAAIDERLVQLERQIDADRQKLGLNPRLAAQVRELRDLHEQIASYAGRIEAGEIDQVPLLSLPGPRGSVEANERLWGKDRFSHEVIAAEQVLRKMPERISAFRSTLHRTEVDIRKRARRAGLGSLVSDSIEG